MDHWFSRYDVKIVVGQKGTCSCEYTEFSRRREAPHPAVACKRALIYWSKGYHDLHDQNQPETLQYTSAEHRCAKPGDTVKMYFFLLYFKPKISVKLSENFAPFASFLSHLAYSLATQIYIRWPFNSDKIQILPIDASIIAAQSSRMLTFPFGI